MIPISGGGTFRLTVNRLTSIPPSVLQCFKREIQAEGKLSPPLASGRY